MKQPQLQQSQIEEALASLPLGKVVYFPRVGSTNDVAAEWASQGAPDLSLAVADEQTAGRGRAGRKWYTPPGSALAMSLILRPASPEPALALPRMTALGALAVSEALTKDYGLQTQIKWPNDVLLAGDKVAGVLAEAHWLGNDLQAIVLGIGINVAPTSVPPAEMAGFPATCVEAAAGRPVDRLALLKATLTEIIAWRPRLHSGQFLEAWEARLAFRQGWVRVSGGGIPPIEGRLLGLDAQGRLKIHTQSGEIIPIQAGDVSLRPVDKPPK